VDLTHPLSSLTPSLESSILEVLAGTEAALNASTIARLSARGTRTGQWPVLNRLVRHGLVTAEPSNSGSLYLLNREHVLVPSILSAVAARQEILRRLVEGLVLIRPQVIVSAALYGSFARGEAGPDSDVDLLLIVAPDVSDQESWIGQLNRLEDQFLGWTGNQLEVLTMRQSDLPRLAETGEPLLESLRNEAIAVFGRTLTELLPEPAHRTPVVSQ